MAKITALPLEETPDGSETVVLVKGGATKQATLSALVEPIVQPYAEIAEAAAQAFRVENSILRPDQQIATSVGANAANTRIVGPPAGRDGVIKRIRIRFVAAGSVDVRVYDRTSGIGPIATGHSFEQSGEAITLTGTAAGWRQFDVDMPISEGQFIGFTSAANVTGYALASAQGFYDNYGVPDAEGDLESLTITGSTTAFVFLIGFDIVTDVVTAEAFDNYGQRVTDLENTSTFFAATPDEVLAPRPGRQGVIGTIGPVWSDGVSWYQTADNKPLDLAWTRLAALAVRDGWEGIYDIGNPHRRTLVGDGLAALSDAKGSLPDLVARSNMPTLDAAIGELPAIETGGSGPTPLRSTAFAQPLSDDYTVMFLAQADIIANGRYFLDGNVSTNRVSVLINSDSFRLFSLPGGEVGAVPADTEPHLFAVTVAPTAARMTIDHATVASLALSSAPALPGLTLADRHAPSGDNSLQGKMGPVLVYRGKITAAADLQMRKLLTELGGLAPPTIEATSNHAFAIVEGEEVYSKDADVKRGIASITKMMALIVAWENYLSTADLDSPITLTAADAVSNPDNGITLLAGDTLTLRELMYAAMLPSSNNACTALSRLTGETLPGEGTAIAKFLDAMRAKATALGMVGTTWSSSWGGGTASAKDCATLALAYADVPELAEIGGTVSYPINVTGENARALTASSSFASNVPFLVCGKTGTGESLFSLAVVCDLPGGSRGAFVALRAPSSTERLKTVNSMVNYCAWEDA